ncbi:MAG: TadE/TadG family type IV pilus assembly protein [Pirellulaceae bacterium]
MNILRYSKRDGGAATEAAICLPIILLIISATVELSTAIYLKESLTIAAYEGARIAISRDADDERVRDRIAEVLAERSIDIGDVAILDRVSVSPASDVATMLQPIEIEVSAPTAGNVVLPFRFLQFVTPEEMSATVVMRKEFTLELEEEDEE